MGESLVSSADSVTFLLGVLVLCFVATSRPKKTDLFYTDLIGVIAMMVEIAIEHVFLLFAGLVQYRYDSLIPFTILGIFYMLAHLTVLTTLVIYVSRLAVVRRFHGKWHFAFYILLCLVYVAVGAIMFLRGDMVVIEHGLVVENRFFNYIGYISIAVTALQLIASLVNRKYYPRPLYKYIITLLPFMLVVEVVQMFYSKIIFTGFIFMMPLMTLFFLFHNNSYDQYTGCQDEATFGGTVEYCAKKNYPYHLVYLRIPRLMGRDFAEATEFKQETLFSFWEACRQVEYMDDNVYVYQLSKGEFAIAYGSKEANMPKLLASTKALFTTGVASIGEGMTFQAYHLEKAAMLSNHAEAKNFFHFVTDYFGSSVGNAWYECDASVLKQYASYNQIRNTLLEIKDAGSLEDDRVVVYAQPIYDLQNKCFRTAEALMRMQIDGRMVFPDQFIPLAEKTDCIHALTLIILNRVCQMVTEWQKTYQVDAITVNCSSEELSDARFAGEVIEILRKNHTNPANIRLEITEGNIFDNFNIVHTNLTTLEDYGIAFYLDDYGTGYSNMERVFNCNFHTIKFDKSLLYRAMEDTTLGGMVQAMIKAFKEKGYHVLIEGVEDEEQVRISDEWGFEYIQGYYFAKPVPAENLPNYFTPKEEAV